MQWILSGYLELSGNFSLVLEDGWTIYLTVQGIKQSAFDARNVQSMGGIMAKGVTNPDYLNGVPELAVLRVLMDGPQHGYAIVQSIAQRTCGTLQFGEGSIYPSCTSSNRKGFS